MSVDLTDRRSPRYVAILAVVAGVILVAGWLLRPRDIPESPPLVPSESDLQELARRSQRRALESTTGYFAELATRLRPSLGYVPALQATALVWDASHLVTARAGAVDQPVVATIRMAAGERAVETTSSPRLPVALLEVNPASATPPARRATRVPQPGEWVVAVWLTGDAPAFSSGTFEQETRTSCGMTSASELTVSIRLTGAMTGGGLFNLDGELLAVILPCNERVGALTPPSIDGMLQQVATLEERLLARFGMLVSALSSDDRLYFSDATGLLVREVWNGSRGDLAGLNPGDVVVALNDVAIAAIDDLWLLAADPAPNSRLTVRRGSTTRTFVLEAPGALAGRPVSTDRGIVLESASPRFRIDGLAAGSAGARAGIRPGDVLRRINHVEPTTSAQAAHVLTSDPSRPLLLEIERKERRLAIVVPGGRP